MALPPSVTQNKGVQHTNDPVTIIDYPSYVSVREWGGAQSSAFGVSPPTSYSQLGSGVSDDSAAINAAFVALQGSGLSLFFPAGTYLVTANAIVTQGVPVILGPGALFTGTYAATLQATRASYARNVMTTVHTSTTYTGTGTNTITFGSNATMAAQDGVTNVVGDVVLLQGGTLGACAITAADTGPWVVSSIGGASAKVVLTRPTWFLTGAQVDPDQTIQIGPEGTLFQNSRWFSSATPGCVIGTTDPAFYPESVIQTVTLAASAKAITNVPILSATTSTVQAQLSAVGGTTTSTIGYGTVVAQTAGYIGTVTTTVNAIASGGTKNGTADTSVLIVTIRNR
jgi:hypothetical protein